MRPDSNLTDFGLHKYLNGSLNKHDCGLEGLDGAETIIQDLRIQKPARLILSHNELGNEGCVALFDYLCSNEGRSRHNIEELSLNANEIGDRGLLAIAKYLDGNMTLGSLYLQNNNFKGDHFVMLRFTVALNRSNLHTLSLTSNVDLAEALTDTFLPSLSSLSLIELHLSVCGLGPKAIPSLLSYLSSPRSVRLFTLKLNGNNFGLDGTEMILSSLQNNNWGLVWLEMQACGVNSHVWKPLEGILRDNILTRNRLYANKVAWEALGLLHYARPALLILRGHLDDSELEDPTVEKDKRRRSNLSMEKNREPSIVSPCRRFPLELDMHILKCLAPSLSPTQFARVCAFAEDMATLPLLGTNGLSLPTSASSSRVFPLSMSMPSDDLQSRGGLNPYLDVSGSSAPVRHGVYFESPTRKLIQRKIWLRMVGCDRFENFRLPALPSSTLKTPVSVKSSDFPDDR